MRGRGCAPVIAVDPAPGQWPFMLEHLAEITAIDPAITGGTPDKCSASSFGGSPITSAGRFSPRRPRDIRYAVSAFAMRVSLLSIDVIWSCRTFI